MRSTSEFWWGAATKRQGESSVQVRRCPATVMRGYISESEYPLAGFVHSSFFIFICEVRMINYVEFSDKSLLGWMWIQGGAAATPKNRPISLLL